MSGAFWGHLVQTRKARLNTYMQVRVGLGLFGNDGAHQHIVLYITCIEALLDQTFLPSLDVAIHHLPSQEDQRLRSSALYSTVDIRDGTKCDTAAVIIARPCW